MHQRALGVVGRHAVHAGQQQRVVGDQQLGAARRPPRRPWPARRRRRAGRARRSSAGSPQTSPTASHDSAQRGSNHASSTSRRLGEGRHRANLSRAGGTRAVPWTSDERGRRRHAVVRRRRRPGLPRAVDLLLHRRDDDARGGLPQPAEARLGLHRPAAPVDRLDRLAGRRTSLGPQRGLTHAAAARRAPTRPTRRVPTNPDDDEEFLAGLRLRAEEQRRRAREQGERDARDASDGEPR